MKVIDEKGNEVDYKINESEEYLAVGEKLRRQTLAKMAEEVITPEEIKHVEDIMYGKKEGTLVPQINTSPDVLEPWQEPGQTNCKCEDFAPVWDKDRQQYFCDSCSEYQD